MKIKDQKEWTPTDRLWGVENGTCDMCGDETADRMWSIQAPCKEMTICQACASPIVKKIAAKDHGDRQMTTDPAPDIFDICVVLNEATDAPLGTSFIPYAERAKAIVIAGLIAEADDKAKLYGGGIDYLTNNMMWTMVSRWLIRKLVA